MSSSSKQLLFSDSSWSYCSDYTWFSSDLGIGNWKVENGLVYYQHSQHTRWTRDYQSGQLAYQAYLTRLITEDASEQQEATI